MRDSSSNEPVDEHLGAGVSKALHLQIPKTNLTTHLPANFLCQGQHHLPVPEI